MKLKFTNALTACTNLCIKPLEQRRIELVGQLLRLTQQKLKGLAAQRDQCELVQTQLSSCLDYVEGSLKTGSEGEILAMKTPVLKQIGQIAAEFNPHTLAPEQEANIQLLADESGPPPSLQTVCWSSISISLP